VSFSALWDQVVTPTTFLGGLHHEYSLQKAPHAETGIQMRPNLFFAEHKREWFTFSWRRREQCVQFSNLPPEAATIHAACRW